MKSNNLNRTITISLLVLVLPALLGMATGDSRAYERITLLHTNDIQGHFVPVEATWVNSDSPPMVGGMASYKTYLRRERIQATHENRGLLVVDAGDWFTGTPESDLTEGKAMIEALNQIPLDFTTIGNHEFDVGVPKLIERIEQLNHPVIISNVFYQSDTRPFPGTRSHVVISKQGIKIGIFGLLLDEMEEITLPDSIKRTIFKPEERYARKMIKKLRSEGAQFIIALTHMGLEEDMELARRVKGLDLIVGGHSHTRLHQAREVNGVLVVQAGSRLTQVGRLDLDLDVESGELLRYRSGLVTLYHDRYPPDKEVQSVVEPYVKQVRERLSGNVGNLLSTAGRSSTTSSALGNLLTDAMRDATGADMAFQNSYGIRANLSAGPVQLRELYTVLPFGNEMVELTLSGDQIRRLMEQSATLEKGLLQMSGLKVELDMDRPKGERVIAVKYEGNPLKNGELYRVVTNSFLAEGGDRFVTFSEGKDKVVHSGRTLRDALKNYLKSHTPLNPPQENRYHFRSKKPSKSVH